MGLGLRLRSGRWRDLGGARRLVAFWMVLGGLLLVVPLVFGFSPVRCFHLLDLLLPLAQLSHKKVTNEMLSTSKRSPVE